MKDQAVQIGWTILSFSILPLARLATSGLIKLVNASPQEQDNNFLVALAKEILAKREAGEV